MAAKKLKQSRGSSATQKKSNETENFGQRQKIMRLKKTGAIFA